METEQQNNSTQEMWRNWERQRNRGKVFGGIILIGAGALLLARKSGIEIPYWIFSWEMFLVVMGLFVGVKHGFKRRGWILMVLFGALFLMDDVLPGFVIKPYFWPIALILLGIFMIFKPRRNWQERKWKRWERMHGTDFKHSEFNTSEDYLNVTNVFSGVKKNFISKDFKGGEMQNVFGGIELNLSQADINGKVTLTISQVFGGTSLIIPANWELQSEMTCVLGGVEDKRPVYKDVVGDGSKVLVLKGDNVFGGVDIKSY